MEITRFITHYGMHLLVPGFFAYIFYRKQWKEVWLIFILTILVDLDHIVATPIFSATRCSINYHIFHSYIAITIYFMMLIPKKTRIIAIGLLFHMLTDWLDCFWLT